MYTRVHDLSPRSYTCMMWIQEETSGVYLCVYLCMCVYVCVYVCASVCVRMFVCP